MTACQLTHNHCHVSKCLLRIAGDDRASNPGPLVVETMCHTKINVFDYLVPYNLVFAHTYNEY